MNLVEAIRRANEPRPPENSLRLRIACTGAVLVSIAAAAAQGEMTHATSVAGMAMVCAGMLFSYVTRSHPPGWIKILVAVGAIWALVWFFDQVGSRTISDITTVEDPLTVLFVLILVVHSFHVPAQRDLLFALGASAALIAVGAAQAIDLNFGVYAIAWMALGFWTLTELWTSTSGGGRVSGSGLTAAVISLSAVAAAVFLVLPAPTVAVRISFEAKAGSGGSIGVPGALAGDSGSASELSRAGTRSGPTRVGGYLGFANSLDTALRGSLGKTVVMRVRAERPSYWVGETFDSWDGQNWSTTAVANHQLPGGSPFFLQVGEGNEAIGQSDLQTFFVASPTADLVFHAESAHEVWFPASSLYYSADGTMVSPIGLGKGAVYTVESEVRSPSPNELRLSSLSAASLGNASLRRFLELPHPYPNVQALAQAITAGDLTTYDKIQSLIAWMGANTRYSTDIPPLPRGADTVDEFLFGDRTGFCEQISTSLAVMLRTLGIPAREAVGYVPGPYNPITDLYDVQARDAHAWVQVLFPGYGWQSFDPTASVPAANPSPGTTALHDLGKALGRIPPVPVGTAAAVFAAVAVFIRWRRSMPATWAEHVARRIEAAGRRAGRRRLPGETIWEYASALAPMSAQDSLLRLAGAVEASAYGGKTPEQAERKRLLGEARRLRVRRAHRRIRPSHRRTRGRTTGVR
jgi:protein-glutamine gamma-glutamyltransferase